MDASTSLSICQAIGTQLRNDFQPASPLPPRLQTLLAALDDEQPDSTLVMQDRNESR